MTREEAIIYLKQADVTVGRDIKTKTAEALEMAIKALEQEPILDKMRAEIEDLTYYCCEIHPRTVIDDVLNIIDKYKAESDR